MPKHFVSGKNETIRLYESDILERLTHVHWSVPLILYLPVSTFLIVQCARAGRLAPFGICREVIFGLLVWTLTEYLLHRFVFHYQPVSAWGLRLHYLVHGIHHDYPQDASRLVMPPAASIPLSALFYGLFGLLMPSPLVNPFFAGFLLGYLGYDEIHFAIHHRPMKSTLGTWLKRHHMRHHYLDPERGYGVSSPLWDVAFGTTFRVLKNRKPAELGLR